MGGLECVCMEGVDGQRHGQGARVRFTRIPSTRTNQPSNKSPTNLVGEEHGEAVHAAAPAAGGGQRVLQRHAEVLVVHLS